MNVNSILEHVAATSSKNEKIARLTAHRDNATLKRAVQLALDPFTQFYQRKIPSVTPKNGMFDDGGVLALDTALQELEQLSSRKVTGGAAIQFLTTLLGQVSADDADVLAKVVQKDLRAGFAESTANKVWPGLVKEYPVMLATPFDEKLLQKFTFPAMAQLKLDGMRFNAIVNNGAVEFRSRTGKEISLHGNLTNGFRQWAKTISADLGTGNLVFDGELLVVDSKGVPLDRKTGNGILNKAVKGTISEFEAGRVIAVIWDVVALQNLSLGYWNKAYKERYAALANTSPTFFELNTPSTSKIRVVRPIYVKSVAEATNVFQNLYDRGEEGIILKDVGAPWEDKRSKYQIKFKGEIEADLLVTDWIEGTGKYAGMLGAITCTSADETVVVDVGSGFSDKQRQEFTRKHIVGQIVEVRYNSIITKKDSAQRSLFLPRFVRERPDKNTATQL